ncbi:50S ribosomal protein L10 [Halobacteriales archaeon QS_3_64_16]|nr:MAG: 50S ribosomal protein L10 [Halobacteriales archaeon QS_3_64_16]
MAAEADAESESERVAESDHRTAEIPDWKREEIDALREVIDSYDSVGVVSVAGIPSRQLQAMRADLRGRAELRVARNTLLERALDAASESSDANGDGDERSGIALLRNEVAGQVGLIATDDNPFGLYRQLEASKTPAPINPGETAPNAIVIPEGDTGIDPGPFVGELQQVGASARIMEGSIQVTEDSTVLEEGEAVSRQLANVLNELGIEPKEVGLDLQAVYSEGTIFEPEELALDIEQYQANFEAGAARARSLSIGTAYPTAETAPALLGKAHGEAKSVGLAGAVESPDLAPDLLSQASGDLRALAAAIDDEEALPEELQGVEDTQPDAEAASEADEAGEGEAEAEADAEDSDDDDDDAGGEGLGEMFG